MATSMTCSNCNTIVTYPPVINIRVANRFKGEPLGQLSLLDNSSVLGSSRRHCLGLEIWLLRRKLQDGGLELRNTQSQHPVFIPVQGDGHEVTVTLYRASIRSRGRGGGPSRITWKVLCPRSVPAVRECGQDSRRRVALNQINI